MAFEPISGTIGAVAFADQLFSRCVWTYTKYKLTRSFGDDYIAYNIKYHSEIVRFEEVINHPISGLNGTTLDVEGRRLKDPLRDRLLLWLLDLKRCEDLVVKCERWLEPGDDVLGDNATDQASVAVNLGVQVSEASAPSATSPAPDILASSAWPPIAPATQTVPSLVTGSSESTITKPRPPPQRLHKQKAKRIFQRLLLRGASHRPFSHEQQTVPQSGPSSNCSLTSTADPARAELAERAIHVHGRSRLLSRVAWVANSRSDFIALLDELKEHANFFNSMILLSQSKQTVLESQEADELRTKVDRYRNIGNCLRMLLQSLPKLTGSEEAVFQLMLHDNPFLLQSNFRTSSKLPSLRLGSVAFYTRLSTPKSTWDGAVPVGSPEQRDSSSRYLVFDVQQTSASPSLPIGTIATTELSSISHLLDEPVEAAQRPTWARELGHIKAPVTASGFISALSDSTIHAAETTLADSLKDEREKQFFQLASQASFRARLALVLTCSLIYAHIAEGARDLTAQELTYYSTQPSNVRASDLRRSRINPFVLLQSVGLQTTRVSSHEALTSAARDHDDETTSMIRSLGVLLYEIGSWTVSVGATVSERANFVKPKHGALAGDISVRYCDAITSCLGARKEDLGNLESWMVENVAEPLHRVLRDIEGLQLIP